MPVQFKMVPKQNNLASPPEVKYYPCAVSKGEIDLDELATIISSRCTISKADCYGVMMAMSDVIGESLSKGSIVKIEPLGSFSITLTGSGAENQEPLGKSNIKAAKVLYKPSKNIKKTIKEIEFKRIR
jgi:predicted histone-like DNA-binding protein